MKPITDEALRKAVEMHSSGLSWVASAKAIGVSYDRLRGAADAEFAQARRDRINAVRRGRYRHNYIPPTAHRADYRLKPHEALAALSTIPPDTRTFNARFMGDPLPTRSALDRKMQAVTSLPPTINISHMESESTGATHLD